jgi:predicted AlkP superfamily phosphohydrolase/phosphomutase
MVSGFMWPGGDAPWCFPRGLETELVERFGPYQADVEGFRASDLDRIYRDIVAMTEQHFSIAEHIWDEQKPDFLMMVEIGLDRFHHAFWRHIDPAHPGFDPASPWKDLGLEYYGRLDQKIGRLLQRIDESTSILVVSDHGARAMHGGFCINEWLRRNRYLSLIDTPRASSALDHARIDWSRTRAWAEGGYYARVFLNVAGREPEGIVAPDELRSLRTQLREELETLNDDEGNPIATSIRIPEDDYREARGFPPDLMVYFDDLRLRAIGSVGTGRLRVVENDTGPDGCNHDWNGVFIMSGGVMHPRGRVDGAEIYDIAPTILGAFGVPLPPELFGRDWTK